MFQNIILGTTNTKNINLEESNSIETDVQLYVEGAWTTMEASYIRYRDSTGDVAYGISKMKKEDGTEVKKDGVKEAGNYPVTIDKLLKDAKSEDINYIQLWRIIVNGYPYKEPKDLGVDTIQEAYFITEQAIDCVMLNRKVGERYRGTSQQGNHIVKEIEKLTNIGLNGEQMPLVSNLRVKESKDEEWVEENKNYTKTYIVDDNVEISQYEVKILKGNEYGVHITDSNGKSRLSFKGGEVFKVNIPKSQFDKKIDIEFDVTAKCKTYPIFYCKTTVEGTQDYAITDGEFRRIY